MINVECLTRYLDESLQKIGPAVCQDVVLVVGNTGAGKSTLINYQLGFGMHRYKGKAAPITSDVPAEMGGGEQMLTLHPSVYFSSHDIVYCECPDLSFDRMGEEFYVGRLLAMDALLKLTRKIDAVIVVIDWRCLELNHGAMMEMTKLASLFKPDVNFPDAVLFAFSHVPVDQDIVYIVEIIEEALGAHSRILQKFEQDRSRLEAQQFPIEEVLGKIEAQRKKIFMLNMILQNKNSIFITNVFDHGETRQFLIDKVHMMREETFFRKDAFHDFASFREVRRAHSSNAQGIIEAFQMRAFKIQRRIEEYSTKCNINAYNLNKIISLVRMEGQQDLLGLAGKDIVLVLGQTGAGKSTLLNYLLSYPMKVGRGGHAVPTDPAIPAPAKMGRDPRSITRLPGLYNGIDGLVYCDCPGFLDTEGTEFRIVNSILTESLIERARSVKAVAVVIDYRAMKLKRGENFMQIASILSGFFHSGWEPWESIFFVFNRLPKDMTEEDIAKEIEELVIEYAERATATACHSSGFFGSSDVSNQEIDCRALSYFLSRILSSNLIILNVFDEGGSRKRLETCFINSNRIAANLFNRETFGKEKKQLMQYFSTELHKVLSMKAELIREQDRLHWLATRDGEIAEKISILRLEEHRLSYEQAAFCQQYEGEKERHYAQFASLQTELKNLKIRLEGEKTAISESKIELSTLDSAEEVFYKSATTHRYNPGLFQSSLSFHYKDRPYKRVVVNKEYGRGEYFVYRNDALHGVYESKLRTSSERVLRNASVDFFMEKRNLPANLQKINSLREQISDLERSISKLRVDIAACERDLYSTQIGPNQTCFEREIASFAMHVDSCRSNIENLEWEKRDIMLHYEACKHAIQEAEEDFHFWLSTPLVKKFFELYNIIDMRYLDLVELYERLNGELAVYSRRAFVSFKM